MSSAGDTGRPDTGSGRSAAPTLRMPDEIAELVRTLHPEIKQKIRAALRTILANPDAGKALRNDLAGLRSFRLGHLRIVFRVETTTGIAIIAIGPRRSIYEETLLRVKRSANPGTE